MSIWEVKKICFPKNKPQLPVAKRNIAGKIITNPNELKNIYLKHFIFRMRKRPILPGLENYQKDVELNFRKVLNSTKNIAFPDWNMVDLDRVLRTLTVSQSPDRMNLVNELFLQKNIGHNLKMSLLTFFNKVKNEQYIPEFLKKVYITSIPKKRKSP